MMLRTSPAAAVTFAMLLLLAGCGSSPADQVRGEVQDLAQAAAGHSYATICQQILDPSLVAHLVRNGIPCTAAMRTAFSHVRDPVVSVGKVIVRGSRAWAITLTSARGQVARLVAIELSRTPSGWRITSLASPLSAAEGR
jgi:hypothetical protein